MVVNNRDDFLDALKREEFDLILSDNSLPGFDGVEAIKMLRKRLPHVPVITVSGADSEAQAREALQAGATA